MSKVIQKNLPLEEKQKELKKAMDIDIQNFIKMRQKEYEKKLATETISNTNNEEILQSQRTPVTSPPPLPPPHNDDDSAMTETTDNTIQ